MSSLSPSITTDKSITAYLYNSYRRGFIHESDNRVKITSYHPDTIRNVEYSNLIRLVPIHEASNDPAPLATRYELAGRSDNKQFVTFCVLPKNSAYFTNVTHLAPIEEDRETPLRVKPVVHNDYEAYYEQTVDNDSSTTYYAYDPTWTPNWEVTLNTQDAISKRKISPRVIEQQPNSELKPVSYAETLFSQPALQDHRNNEHVDGVY